MKYIFNTNRSRFLEEVDQFSKVSDSVVSPHFSQNTVTATLDWNMEEGVDSRMRQNGSYLLTLERKGREREGKMIVHTYSSVVVFTLVSFKLNAS